ncbi:hypothetical protein QR680_000206 [Steinernema hermaphroditum]|uniref:PDZ domain-containing protein n=1 Tax=Steinernema hermaphroditum TaxID=289476 RepID=A0AA39LDW7_9BILA|nr:hypothetical protein QR680_000206 [Steinernema hermaphroditum]
MAETHGAASNASSVERNCRLERDIQRILELTAHLEKSGEISSARLADLRNILQSPFFHAVKEVYEHVYTVDDSFDQISPAAAAKATVAAFAAAEGHSHPRIVDLAKTDQGLGFNVMGGREQNSPIYISRIIPGGVADREASLKRGDQLLAVNGVNVERESHEKAVELLKSAQGRVKLVARQVTFPVTLALRSVPTHCCGGTRLRRSEAVGAMGDEHRPQKSDPSDLLSDLLFNIAKDELTKGRQNEYVPTTRQRVAPQPEAPQPSASRVKDPEIVRQIVAARLAKIMGKDPNISSLFKATPRSSPMQVPQSRMSKVIDTETVRQYVRASLFTPNLAEQRTRRNSMSSGIFGDFIAQTAAKVLAEARQGSSIPASQTAATNPNQNVEQESKTSKKNDAQTACDVKVSKLDTTVNEDRPRPKYSGSDILGALLFQTGASPTGKAGQKHSDTASMSDTGAQPPTKSAQQAQSSNDKAERSEPVVQSNVSTTTRQRRPTRNSGRRDILSALLSNKAATPAVQNRQRTPTVGMTPKDTVELSQKQAEPSKPMKEEETPIVDLLKADVLAAMASNSSQHDSDPSDLLVDLMFQEAIEARIQRTNCANRPPPKTEPEAPSKPPPLSPPLEENEERYDPRFVPAGIDPDREFMVAMNKPGGSATSHHNVVRSFRLRKISNHQKPDQIGLRGWMNNCQTISYRKVCRPRSPSPPRRPDLAQEPDQLKPAARKNSNEQPYRSDRRRSSLESLPTPETPASECSTSDDELFADWPKDIDLRLLGDFQKLSIFDGMFDQPAVSGEKVGTVEADRTGQMDKNKEDQVPSSTREQPVIENAQCKNPKTPNPETSTSSLTSSDSAKVPCQQPVSKTLLDKPSELVAPTVEPFQCQNTAPQVRPSHAASQRPASPLRTPLPQTMPTTIPSTGDDSGHHSSRDRGDQPSSPKRRRGLHYDYENDVPIIRGFNSGFGALMREGCYPSLMRELDAIRARYNPSRATKDKVMRLINENGGRRLTIGQIEELIDRTPEEFQDEICAEFTECVKKHLRDVFKKYDRQGFGS